LGPFTGTSYLAPSLLDQCFPAELWLKEDIRSIPTFLQRFRQHFSGDVGGHSLRAGGATTLAEAGIPPHMIQAIGHWSSEAEIPNLYSSRLICMASHTVFLLRLPSFFIYSSFF
jgi:hypothetical protein